MKFTTLNIRLPQVPASGLTPPGTNGQVLYNNGGSLGAATGLVYSSGVLIGYPLDSAVVHITGAETVSGLKTFSNLATFDCGVTISGTVTVNSVPYTFPTSGATGNQLVLTSTTTGTLTWATPINSAYAYDTGVVHLSGTETISGLKTFSNLATFDCGVTVSGTVTINSLPYVYPSTQTGGVLVNDGSGTLSWSSLNGAGAHIRQGIERSTSGAFTAAITYNTGTYVVQVSGVTGTFNVWISGALYTKTGVETWSAHATGAGVYYHYYDGAGVKTITTTEWEITNHVPVCIVSIDTGGNSIATYEAHDSLRNVDWHEGQHRTIGTYYVSGFTMGGYTTGSATTGGVTWSLSSGTIADEDIFYPCTALADNGPYVSVRRIGTGNNWVGNVTGEAYPFISTGGYIQYNSNTGAGGWDMVAIANNRWLNYWVMAVPALDSARQIIVIPGQVVYTSLASAQAEGISSVNLTGLPLAEFVPIYRVTFETSAAYGNPGKCAIASVAFVNTTRSSSTASIAASTLSPATTVTAVASASVVGTALTYSREDHVHDIATGAFNAYANVMSGVVHTSGAETITGAKTFTDVGTFNGGITSSGTITLNTVPYTFPSAVATGSSLALTSTTGGVLSWASLGGGTLSASATVSAVLSAASVGTITAFSRGDHVHNITSGIVTGAWAMGGAQPTTGEVVQAWVNVSYTTGNIVRGFQTQLQNAGSGKFTVYDAIGIISGSTGIDHCVLYQGALYAHLTGTMNAAYGFYALGSLETGTIVSGYGFYHAGWTGTGVTNKWAYYEAVGDPSYFKGYLQADGGLKTSGSTTFNSVVYSWPSAVATGTTAALQCTTGGTLSWTNQSSAWNTGHTPTVTSAGGAITAYTPTFRYVQLGSFIYFCCKVVVTTKGTATGSMEITVPTAKRASTPKCTFTAVESVTVGALGIAYIDASTSSIFLRKYDWTTPFMSDGDTWELSGWYEV